MIRILLIRHGTTDLSGLVLYGRKPGVHLNAEGRRQAESLTAALKQRYYVDLVVSSPLERALETAQPIAAAFNRTLSIENRLTELDFGAWAGVSFADLHHLQDWREFNRLRSLCSAPEGESMMDVQARAWRAVQAIVAPLNEPATVAIVTHGDVIRCILLLLLGIPMDHIHRIEVAPGSLSEFTTENGHVVVRSMNQIFY